MTRERAITFLNIIADELGFPDTEGYTLEDRKRMREAIEVLAQEPSMNKPCVASQLCHEDKIKVLDKIKSQILDEAEYAYADFDRYKEDILHAEPDELPDDDFRYGLQRAIEIINEHISEVRE